MSDLNDPNATACADLNEPSSETVVKIGTDLPIAQSGMGGSINEPAVPCERCPYVLLDHALAAVPAPPLDDASRSAAYRWLAEVERGLVFRRERRILANAVHRALGDEYRSRQHIESIRRTMQRAAARDADRDAGIYWTRREAGRISQRPVRVEVDTHAWETFKLHAERAGTTVGEHLGRLAAESASRSPLPACAENDRWRRVLFVRIAIDDADWTEFRHRTQKAGWTIARCLGTLAESEAP